MPDTGLTITVDKRGSVSFSTASTKTVFSVDRSLRTDPCLVDQMLAVLTQAKARLTAREEQHRLAEAAGFKVDDGYRFDAWFKCTGSSYWLVRTGTDAEAAPFYWSRRNPFCTWAGSSRAAPAMTLDEALDACLQDIATSP